MANEQSFSEEELAFLSKAKYYCARGEQCIQGVAEKMRDWGVPEPLQQRILESLVEEGYVDETRYCRIYCDSKLRLNKWGRKKIRFQLKMKRIPTTIIDDAINNIDIEEYNTILSNLAETKWRSLRNEPIPKRKAKTMAFLASKGFDNYEIIAAVETLMESDN